MRGEGGGTFGPKKLTAEDALLIYKDLEAGQEPGALAIDFGVTQQTISEIWTGKSWGHVTGKVLKTSPRAQLTTEDVMAIDHLLQIGVRGRAIAANYAVSEQAISNIKTGRDWSWLTGRRPKRRNKL
jgi:hypothetical protein